MIQVWKFPTLAIPCEMTYLSSSTNRKPTMAKIVTANTLATGAVVFLGRNERWVDAVGNAWLFADADAAEEGLAIAQRDAQRAIVVDPFVTDKGPDADGKPGMTLRDTIRAFGPTIKFLPTDVTIA